MSELNFPSEWGEPPDDPEERQAWVLEHLEKREAVELDTDDGELHTRQVAIREDPTVPAPASRGASSEFGTIRGTAVPYLDASSPLFEGGVRFVEVIHPDAFADQVRNRFDGTLGLWMHQRHAPMARVGANMEMTHERDGVKFTMQPAGMFGRTAVELTGRGVTRGASIGFRVFRHRLERVEVNGKPMPLRTVTKGHIAEVSIVSTGAYPGAKIGLREAVASRAPEARGLTAAEARRDFERHHPGLWAQLEAEQAREEREAKRRFAEATRRMRERQAKFEAEEHVDRVVRMHEIDERLRREQERFDLRYATWRRRGR